MPINTDETLPAISLSDIENIAISVIVPVFNEEDNIENAAREIHQALKPLGRYEVIWIDDGSSDRSASLLAKICSSNPNNKAVYFRRNYGQTAAMQAGFRTAKGEILIPIDSDLQNDPADIPRLVAELNKGYDVVSGWRRQRQDNAIRKIPSKLANRLIRKLTGVYIHDYGCTLKAYRAQLMRDVNLYGEMHRFIPALVAAQGGKVTEIEVNHRPRTAGVSKYGISRTFRVILDILTVVFLGRYLTRPLHLFGTMALYGFGAGTLMMGWIGFEKFALGIWVHRNPWFVIMAVTYIASLQLLMTGLLAELIMRGYFESQGRLTYRTKTPAGT